MGERTHLQQLGEFLKVRRGELSPSQLGLPEHTHSRRRVTGLRREGVAQLASISTDYYMRIEQGRLAPSPQVLAAIVDALRLDENGRAYLEGLVGQASKPRPYVGRVTAPSAHPHLSRLVRQLDRTPALVFGPRLDILAWNQMAAELLIDFESVAAEERNYVRLVFTQPAMRAVYPDWKDVARTCVEVLRMEAGTNPADPLLWSLVARLSEHSELFRRWWAEHRVAAQDFGRKRVHHAQVGELMLDWDTFLYAGAPEQQVVLWSAEPGTPSFDRLVELRARF